jgi:predicted nucleic acid-binding protein
MLVVDASCLYEVVAKAEHADLVQEQMSLDIDYAAPHVIDVEVLSTVRRYFRLGRLDRTAAYRAVEELRDWPGERFGHGSLLERAWELRDNVRPWDALYVALAEALGCTLITFDGKLGRVQGLACQVQVLRR